MKAKKINCIWFAPMITLGILLLFYAAAGIYPFGANSSAFSDAVGQYVPMLSEFAQKIKDGSSLLFTWHTGRGTNFLAIIAYYLASPMNLLVLLFDENRIGDAFSIITLLKPVLMALTFGIYYKHVYKRNDVSLVMFSVLWAFSGFIISSLFFVSWYDSIIYFPIVILGLKRLMDGHSGWIYSLFLGLTITSNFYIGWMTCIFCVIYFIYCFISDEDVVYEGVTAPNDKNEAESQENEENVNILAVFKNSYILRSVSKFALSSLLGGALSAVLTLPTAFALMETFKGQTEDSVIVPKSIWGILASHVLPLINNFDTLISTQVIFCFAGIATFVLCVAYFFNKKISARKKIGNAFLLLVMWCSIIFFPLYFVWHGFGIPAGLMYRFAFIYSFVLLKIAIEAFAEIKHMRICGILVGAGVAFLCTVGIYADKVLRAYFFNVKQIVPIILFIVIYTVLFILLVKKTESKKLISSILIVCIIAEAAVLNYGHVNYRNIDGILGEREKVEDAKAYTSEGDYINFAKKDSSFKDVVNYGMLFGYNTTETFSSLANGSFALSVQNFGTFGNALNAEDGAQEQTPIFNMFFPVKYYLDGSNKLTENEFRKLIKENDGYSLYENNFTMPFMYAVPNTIDGWDPFAYISPADEQSAAFEFMTGTEEQVLSYNEMTNIRYENCNGISTTQKREELFGDGEEAHSEFYDFLESRFLKLSCKITDTTKPAYVTFDSVAKNDGIMYFFIDPAQFTDLSITVNGKTRNYSIFGVGDSRTYEVGEVKKGDVVTIKIGGYNIKDIQDGNVYKINYETYAALAYTIDMDVFKEGYERLDSYSDTEILEFSDTYVKAKVNSNIDGLLYIPTPMDKGWTITVDGVETPIHEHESKILMTEITKGEHVVEMKYCPQGFILGVVITGVSVAILIAWAVISKKRNDKLSVCDTIEKNVDKE